MIFGEENVFVRTQRRFQIEAREITTSFCPAGFTTVGFFVEDRMIAQRQAPEGALEHVQQSGLLDVHRAVGMIAHADAEGVHGTVVLVLEDLPEGTEPTTNDLPEPWESTPVPGVDDDDAPEDEPVRLPYMALIGTEFREAKKRKHPSDLGHEAADMLAALLDHGEELTNSDAQAVEDLLDSLDD